MKIKSSSIFPHISPMGIFFLWGICLLSAGLILSACAGQPSPPAAVSTAPAVEASSTPAAPITSTLPIPSPTPTEIPIALVDPKGATINFWHSLPLEQIDPLIEEFNKINPWGITVKASQQSSNNELSEQIAQGLLQKDAPQLALAFTDQAVRWDARNEVPDLNNFLSDPHWGWKEDDTKDFLEQVWQYGIVNNKRLSVPALISGKFFFYNKSWAKEIGFEQPPASLEEFAQQVCAANEFQKKDSNVDNDYTGGWLANDDPIVMLGWLYAFGGGIVSESDVNILRSVYRFDTEANEEAFFYLKDLIDKNCIYVSTEFYGDEEFSNRRALVVSGSTVDLPYQQLAFEEIGSKDEWTLFPYPTHQKGQFVVPLRIPSFILLPATPEQEVASWLFTTWMLSPSTQAKWASLSGYFPARTSARSLMDVYAEGHPQWKSGYDLLTYGKTEPKLPSWSSVQWALQDASTQLFRPYFTIERVPLTLQELDKTAQELIDMGR